MDRSAPARHLRRRQGLPPAHSRAFAWSSPWIGGGVRLRYLVNLSRLLQRRFELFERKVRAARDLQDRRLAAAAEFGGVGNLRGNVDRDDDRAMLVGMDQIVGANRHP